jgi:imidazolonepropionase-like amidohydrolase
MDQILFHPSFKSRAVTACLDVFTLWPTWEWPMRSTRHHERRREEGKERAVIRFGLLPLLALLIPPAARAADEPAPKPWAITHVTVIDTTGGPSQPNMTVIVTGERITAVGKSDTVAVPKDATVIDGTGKFLIPGLWDMHMHVMNSVRDLYFPLYIANGVTGVRVMWGYPEQIEWRKELAAGTWSGPRFALAGPLVDGPSSRRTGLNTLIAAKAAEGREVVRKIKDWGYDFVKIYDALDRDTYFAIAAEAKRLKIPFAGHVPHAVRVAEASDAGQKSIEHLTGVTLGCSTREMELRKAIQGATSDPTKQDLELRRRLVAQTHDSYDEKKAQALFERFAKNRTWQCPTFTVLRAVGHLNDPTFQKDDRLKYIPTRRREQWLPQGDRRFKEWKEEDYASARKTFEKALELVGKMHKAGVPILAGSDVANPYCFSGFSLHDELELLVKAGLAPAEAIKSATLNPAKYLDHENDLGTVAKGKLADLVLLDADPLKDIRNTRRIVAVVLGGKLHTKESLQKMLSDTAAAAAAKT